MRALSVITSGKAEIQEIELRELEPDEILIKVIWAGICATDVSIYTGDISFVKSGAIKYPCRIGHEWSGIVEKTGEKATRFKAGDRVVADNAVACGKCEACKRGLYNECQAVRAVGTINCWDGCFAQYMIMPERHVYKLDDSISLDVASLIEPMTIGLAAVVKYPIKPETTVVVIGTGAIGISAATIAKSYGAGKVIIVGRKKNKLEIALKVGADYAVSTADGNCVDAVMAMTNGRGADFIIETSGARETVIQAINMAAKDGTVAFAGFYETKINDWEIDDFVIKGLNLVGVYGRFGLIGNVQNILANKNIDMSHMITHRISFDELPNYFENVNSYSAEKIKVLVKIGDEF